MTAHAPRIENLLKKTKTVCFGRFLVDVPETAQVIWGRTSNDLTIDVYPNDIVGVRRMAEELVINLKATEAINHNNMPMFLGEEEVAEPLGRIITGFESFDSLNTMKVEGYFSLGADGIVISARPMRDEVREIVSEIKNIASRLRSRGEEEIPVSPGNCLNHAFLEDKMSVDAELPVEHVRVAFRLKEFPDTHLSIYTAPPNLDSAESDTLEWQLARLEEKQKAENPNHPLLKTKYFRRGTRKINEWLNGWEAISRSPDQPGQHGTHEFVMDFKGVPKDLLKPYADVQMQTGVGGNIGGAVKPSLTDEEAIAVWDKITSSIRVRPTSAAPAKTSTAPRLPLGEKVATGSACPQGGWWESSPIGVPPVSRRQRFATGDAMPFVAVAGVPTLWQRIKGERPTFEKATAWKLVGYDDKPAASQASSTQGAAMSPPDRGDGA